MLEDFGIRIKGAREHNLKNLSLDLPRQKFIVVTGLSGSGKSSLVFDTVFAEAQRRFLESMSTYARYFLEQMKRPDLDAISGLQPAIAIDQKTSSLNPRSTVGTITEVYDYLRLLYARKGTPYCPEHKLSAQSQTLEQIQSEIEKLPVDTKFYILSPVAQQKKGEFSKEIILWQKMGIQKARIDGQLVALESQNKLAKTKSHTIELVLDQLIMKPQLRARLSQALKRSSELSKGQVIIETLSGERKYYSLHSSCPLCGFSFPVLDPRFFSFNSPKGACLHCKGLGTLDLIEEEVLEWEGDRQIVKSIKYKSVKESDEEDSLVSQSKSICPHCLGTRLKPESNQVLIQEKNISELSQMEIENLSVWLLELQNLNSDDIVMTKILNELNERLTYLKEVGCGYLTLSRGADTLSGGEAQRLRLASQLGSQLTGVLYVLDEPSIGLHPRDHQKLIKILKKLRDDGNTVLVVEHDEETIQSADYIIDIGPGAGKNGGEILAKGTFKEILSNPLSLTGQYLSGQKKVFKLHDKTKTYEKFFSLKGARGNNLKSVDLKFPVGSFISVTGVSGSGKSTLIMNTLYPALAKHLGLITPEAQGYDSIEGLEFFDKVIEIDQRPIGRTSRSTPLTYVDLATLVRDVFALLPEAKLRGYEAGRFSYNAKVGQCSSCAGLGFKKIEMNFLSDVSIPCDDCHGKRFNRETLNIRFKGKSIADVLDMNISEAYEFFSYHPQIKRKLETLLKVGLDYIQLGQGAPTFSGGEAQRIKLAKELSKRGTGKTLYILDEPTTGLHFEDINKLVELLKELVISGNTVVVIEHNMDLVASSDWIIEMGPEGGQSGGQILFQGEIGQFLSQPRPESPTWSFLKTKFE